MIIAEMCVVDYPNSTATTYTGLEYYEEINTTITIVLDSLTGINDFDDYTFIINDPFDHYINWWDWFRTGAKQQISRKKKVFKKLYFVSKNYWLRILPSKSGWVGKAMKRKKGKCV